MYRSVTPVCKAGKSFEILLTNRALFALLMCAFLAYNSYNGKKNIIHQNLISMQFYREDQLFVV